MFVPAVCYCWSQGHSSFITHLDWSVDSQYLVSNSGDYEILYCKYCKEVLTRFNKDIKNDTILKKIAQIFNQNIKLVFPFQ